MDCREAIISNDVYDYITDFSIRDVSTQKGVICVEKIEEPYSVVYLDRNEVPTLENDFFEYQSIPKLYGIMQENNISDKNINNEKKNIFNLINSGIMQVQKSPLHLTGKGTVIAVIDTGIDYNSPIFKDINGNSRILSIWDQSDNSGTPPEEFYYGSEYTREDINKAIHSERPYDIVPERDTNGHGTALAGIAAGNMNNEMGTNYNSIDYISAAPEAELVIVKLKECKEHLKEFYVIPANVHAYQENDIMQGIKYVDRFVKLFNRPVIICLGLGTNMGDHSGNSVLSRYMNDIAVRRSRAIIVCGGNEGNAGHHYQGFLGRNNIYNEIQNEINRKDNTYQDVEIRVAEGCNGFWMELWGNLPETFNVSVISPGGEIISPIRLGINQSLTYGFVYEETKITIDSVLVEPASGAELFQFRIIKPTAGIWTLRVIENSIRGKANTGTGEFHIWLPISAFLTVPVYFLNPSPYITLTEPAMASEVISVTAYDGERELGSLYYEAGRGYTRLGRIKPDLAAPGVNVSAVMKSGQMNLSKNNDQNIGRDNNVNLQTVLVNMNGSSYAAAITAGAVAQLMQWAIIEKNDQFVESREIKSYLIRGANRNTNNQYPNQEYGYGKLDLEGTFQFLTQV